MKQALGDYLYNILMNIDIDGNVYLIGFIVLFMKVFGLNKYVVPAAGNAHYTISQTLAEMRDSNMEIGCIGCKILTKVWGMFIKKRPYDHCIDAMAGMPEDITSG